MEQSDQVPKKGRIQKYRPEWENDDLFKKWLCMSKDEDAFCKACNSSMMPRKASLVQHAISGTHIKNMKHFNGSSKRNLTSFLTSPVEDDVKKAELKICAAVVEHNISFKFMDHLSDVITSSFSDSVISKRFSCKRTKAMALTNNVSSARMKEKMISDIAGSSEDVSKIKFSIIVDESTDISVKSNLAIVIKYHSETNETIKTKLLNLVEVKDKTAEGLFTSLSSEIHDHGLQSSKFSWFRSRHY